MLLFGKKIFQNDLQATTTYGPQLVSCLDTQKEIFYRYRQVQTVIDIPVSRHFSQSILRRIARYRCQNTLRYKSIYKDINSLYSVDKIYIGEFLKGKNLFQTAQRSVKSTLESC